MSSEKRSFWASSECGSFRTEVWGSKVVWTLGLCGIGTGGVIGTLISLLVVPRWDGLKAIAACTLISLVTLGIGCNLLCFAIDRHFNYFGALDQPVLWLGSGVALSILGGVLSGMTLFTRSGRALLTLVHL